MPSFESPRTRLTALARQDYFAAIRWYKQQSSESVAERFVLEVEQTLERIRRSPLIFPVAARGRRKALLKVFPFQIIFVKVENVLVIVAIMHNSRDPSYWQGRLLPSEDINPN